MAVSLNQFRYFCELAETKHFGRTADRLHMSQPPLSRQIAALEKELGIAVFERTSKGVELTPAGSRFLVDAREVLRLAAQAERNATASGRGDVGQLTLGFTMCAAYSVVPTLTRLYTSAFPNVDLQVRELMPNVLQRELRDGAIDFGISFPGIGGDGVQTEPLLREPLALVLPQGHRLARMKRVKIEELAKERFLIVPRDQAASLHDSIIQRCQAAGFTPIIGLEAYLQQTIVNFVAEGLGVAFVPASMQRAQVKGAVFKTVADPPTIDQLLAWATANKNPCIGGFLATCRAHKGVLTGG